MQQGATPDAVRNRQPPLWRRLLLSAAGAAAYEIALLYSKRLTEPAMAFATKEYVFVTLLFCGVAGLVGAIYPLKGAASDWKIFGLGIAAPTFFSGAATVMRSPSISPRGGGTIDGDLLDLLSLF